MNCTACKWHYVSLFFHCAPSMACLILNGCGGPGLGKAVLVHVRSKAPLCLAAPDTADDCPGFEAGEPIYTEKP